MNYFDNPAISQSMLKTLGENPRKFYELYIAKSMKQTSTAALEDGKAFDLLLTEPDKFKQEYYTINSYGEISCILKDYKLQQFNHMKDSVLNKCIDVEGTLPLREFLDFGSYQEELYWCDPNYFVDCKGKLDWISEDKKLIIDFKTTVDSSYEGFSKSIKTYNYRLQAGMYAYAIQLKYNLKQLPDFMFVAVQKSIPYTTNIFKCSSTMLKEGIEEMKELLGLYSYYMETNEWNHDMHGIIEIG